MAELSERARRLIASDREVWREQIDAALYAPIRAWGRAGEDPCQAQVLAALSAVRRDVLAILDRTV